MIPGYLKRNGPLHRLVRDGGVEIYTPEIIGEPKGDAVLFKSVIQPDGDVITYIYDEKPDAEFWRKHCLKLEAFSAELAALRGFLNKLSYAGPVLGCGIAGLLGWGEMSGWLQDQLEWFIVGSAFSVFFFFLKRIVSWGIKRWAMKKFNRRVPDNFSQE